MKEDGEEGMGKEGGGGEKTVERRKRKGEKEEEVQENGGRMQCEGMLGELRDWMRTQL